MGHWYNQSWCGLARHVSPYLISKGGCHPRWRPAPGERQGVAHFAPRSVASRTEHTMGPVSGRVSGRVWRTSPPVGAFCAGLDELHRAWEPRVLLVAAASAERPQGATMGCARIS